MSSAVKWTLWFHGECDPARAQLRSVGVILAAEGSKDARDSRSETQGPPFCYSRMLGPGEDLDALLMALVLGLDLARRRGVQNLRVLTDRAWVLEHLLEPASAAAHSSASALFLRDRAREMFEQFEMRELLRVEERQTQDVRKLACQARKDAQTRKA